MALPDEDRGEVGRRLGAIEAELGARSELGRALARRAGILTIRLERGYRHEAARLGLAVDGAVRAFDEGRLAAIEALMDGIAGDPATHARRLQATAAGVRYTIEVWQALKADLVRPGRQSWEAGHCERAENLMGRRVGDQPQSRIGALSRALWADPSGLEPGEAAGLDEAGRHEHARDQLARVIDDRVADLEAFAGTFDPAAEERARLGAADRALFDASKEGVLARKDDASTERSLLRTLRELRQVEAEAAAVAAGTAVEGAVAADLPATEPVALASFGPVARARPSAVEPPPAGRSGRARDGEKASRRARRAEAARG